MSQQNRSAKGTDGSAGVSILICCHNSAKRIKPTLQHLMQQVDVESIPWEVIVVNNASTDSTLEVISSVWESGPFRNLRIVNEEELGLIYARLKGLMEASYECVSFVDDDNWVASNWVSTVHRIMKSHPEVGAVGGNISAVFEGMPPFWFDQVSRSYAVGIQGSKSGDISNDIGVLFGAGLSVRKVAWDDLRRSGFTFNLVGRRGGKLSSGEDYELCLALRLAGWKIWYDPSLSLRHFMPKDRLDWMYLRRMLRGVGESDIGLLPYYYALNKKSKLPRLYWLREVVACFRSLIPKVHKLALFKFKRSEGDLDVLQIERSIGLITNLVKQNKQFDRNVQQVQQASWIKI